MDELNAAPSSTEPSSTLQIETRQYADGSSATGVAPLPDVSTTGAPAIAQEAGAAAGGEFAPTIGPASDSLVAAGAVSQDAPAADSMASADAPAVGGGVDAPSHLLLLDAMLAEIERKIAAGIHTFAHEVTAARDHLAKLLP
ncbi:hypothetical protein [Burkholderia sp. HI2500]|uniref:hypothetical protein n=1 Tax=Burkholderia sp. HI2500 TaxID=2015358 RepID=UPI00117D1F7A|nr:hypothetical protein [Burkholderia sp. HI2500]